MTNRTVKDPGSSVEAKSFAYGFVSGNVLPDVDLVVLAFTFPFNSKLAMRMHRTATHSLLIIGIIILLGVLLSTTRGGKSFYRGIGAGMAVHSIVDIFLWFSGIDILWPLGHFGIPSEVNLWTWVKLPRIWGNFLGSTDFLMMGLFYLFLLSMARKYETNVNFQPRLRVLMNFHFIAFGCYVVASFFLSRAIFDVVQYAVLVLVSLPMTVIAIRGSKPTIERMAVSPI